MARAFLTPTLRSQESHSSLSSSSVEDLEDIPRPPSRRRTRSKQPSTSPSSAPAPTGQNHHYRDDQSHGGWNINYAVAHLINHLRNSSDGDTTDNGLSTTANRPTAAQTITTARTYPVPPCQWRDYPGLILPSLSDTVFAGKLNEQAVRVTWERMDDGRVSGRTRPVGGGMVEVQLNAAALQGANRDEIVGTLLHHMIHAYLLVVCGANERKVAHQSVDGDEDESRRHDDESLSHNHAFATILWEIRAQAAKGEEDGARPLPIGFGHRLPSAFPHFMAAAAPRPRASSSSTRKAKSRGSISHMTAPSTPHNCTHCPVSVPTITSEDTSDWYTSECAPFLSTPACMHGNELYSCSLAGDLHPVSRTSASSSYVELIHRGNKPIGVPRAAVDQFSSLKSVLGGDKGNGRRWLELPRTGVGREELGALMTFLRTQTYRPVLSPWGCDRNVEEHRQGAEDTRYGPPPVIQPRPGTTSTRTSGKTSASDSGTGNDGPEPQVHLLRDIHVHHFASAIDFHELAAYALRRLYHAEPTTHEDPIALLEAVYFPGVGGSEVSQQLRAWACSFLSRRDQGSGGVLNMAKLRTHVAWRQRWNGLLSRGGGQGRMLLEDVRKVYADEEMRQQWWKHRQQHPDIPYADRRRQHQPLYAEHVAVEGSGQSPGTNGGEDQDARSPESSWPKWWNQYNTRHHPDFSIPQPTSPRPFPQHFPQWWCGPQHNPYAYPLPLVPPFAPFYPYYAPPQPPPQQKQPPAQMQSRCNHDTSTPCTTAATIAAAAAAATTAATRASTVTAEATGRQGDQKSDKRGKERLRRPASPISRSGRGTRRPSTKQYHPALMDETW